MQNGTRDFLEGSHALDYGIRKKKSASARLASWLAVLILLAALGAGGWYYYELYIVSPRLAFVQVRINGEPRDLLSGDHLALHPRDRIKILEISTNIPFNLYVRVVSSGFDAGALLYREWPILRLLPGQDMFEAYHLPVKIKYRDRELGVVTLDVKPHVDDWLDKANRIIDKKLRLSVLEKACAMFPADARLKKRLLDEYEAQGKWKSLAAMLEKPGNRDDRTALRTLLKSYMATGNSDGVISVLKMLVAMAPKDLATRMQLAETLEKQGKLEPAAMEYNAALGIIPSEKDKLPLYGKLGYLWTKLGNNNKAIIFYQKASQIDPTDANLYYNLSYLNEKSGNRDKYLLYLEKALALKPDDVEGRMKLVQDLVKDKDWKKAEVFLSQVLKKKPKSMDALLLMADVLDKDGKKKELEAVYRTILTLAPNNETVGYNLGVLEYETGNLKGALPYLAAYVKRHPGDAQTHSLLLDIYRKLKDPEKAFAEAMTLTKLGAGDSDTYLYATEYLNSRGDYKQMVPLLEKGLKAHPKAIELRDYLVVAYLKVGMEKEAMAEMEKILEKRPKDLNLLQNLARLREKQGDYPGAVDAYKRIIALDPGNEEAQNAYLRLRLKVMENEKND
jgi:tetratricopeptide (TPR) repeat protein